MFFSCAEKSRQAFAREGTRNVDDSQRCERRGSNGARSFRGGSGSGRKGRSGRSLSRHDTLVICCEGATREEDGTKDGLLNEHGGEVSR